MLLSVGMNWIVGGLVVWLLGTLVSMDVINRQRAVNERTRDPCSFGEASLWIPAICLLITERSFRNITTIWRK